MPIQSAFRHLLPLAALCITFLTLCGATSAQIFVTSTADSGPGSLRQAVIDANSISFATEEIVTIDLQVIQQTSAPARAIVGLTSMIILNRSVNITAAGNLPKPKIGLSGLATGLYLSASSGQLKVILQNLRFEGFRSSEIAGAISSRPGATSTDLEIIGCEFVDNQSSPLATSVNKSGLGAAIYLNDTLIASPSTLKIRHCLFENNRVFSAATAGAHRAEGAAIYVKNAQVIIEDSQFQLNTSDADQSAAGGALRIVGSIGVAEVRRCTFDSNTAALSSNGDGNSGVSALHCTANEQGEATSLLLEDSIFENNSGSCSLGLGGQYDGASSTATILNSTFVKNRGVNSSALYAYRSYGAISLTHCTVSNNSHEWLAGAAVMINNNENLATLSRCVIAGNRQVTDAQQIRSPDVQQTDEGTDKLVSAGYNFIGNAPPTYISVFSATGDRTGTTAAPLLAKLADSGDYGGPTRTCPPLPDSPLVDAIPNAANVITTDQRGTSRPQGATADIGAVELPRVSYDVWDNQITLAADRDRTDDPDHDGLQNRQEYFFGTNPMVANPAPFRMVEDGGIRYLEVIRSTAVRPLFFSRTAVETSTDLIAGSWSASAGSAISSPETVGSLDRIRTLYPVGTDIRRFFRVAVE